jgi:hypothetical protein
MSSINESVHRVTIIPDEVQRRALVLGAACRQTSSADWSMHSSISGLSNEAQTAAGDNQTVRYQDCGDLGGEVAKRLPRQWYL